MILQITLALTALAVSAVGQLNYNSGGSNVPREDCCEDYCYVTDEDPYIYFGTKTSYDSISRRNGQQHVVPDCTPVQFWSLIDQGTSLPEARRIRALRELENLHREVRQNYEERRSYPDKGKLCVDDFRLFTSWRWNSSITEDKANSLTSQGMDELKLLARRYKSKYSQILPSPPNEKDYYFQYSNVGRTHDSYQAYMEGLFGSEAYKAHANTLNEEKIVDGNVHCGGVDQQYPTKTVYQRFIESPEYARMAHDIFSRLGFRYDLNASLVADIYDMCRYEKAWNVQQKSPWCIALTKSHLKMLEYAEDLKYYYKYGYGNDMSSRFGCGSVKDFYNRFERTVNGESDGNRATFLFSNSATMQTVLTTMGIARDYERPTAENYYTQGRRKWRTSLLDPFAANLVAVLYQCRGDEKHKVMFFLNEVPVEYPECSVGLCSWSTIHNKFENLVRSCNAENPCSPQSGSSSTYFSYAALLLSSLFFYLRV